MHKGKQPTFKVLLDKSNMQIEFKDRHLLLEALEDMMYKISLRLEEMKGGPLTDDRKELTKKQKQAEALQHLIYNSMFKT